MGDRLSVLDQIGNDVLAEIVARRLRGVGLERLKVALRIGDPCVVIERTAAQLDPDLIAVGHHTSPLARPFIGSVARHVLRMGPGDVLISRHA